MERLLFRSTAHPDLAYTWNAALPNSGLRYSNNQVSAYAGQFLVYNDWPTQHSPESLVPSESFPDYLHSLGTYLFSLDVTSEEYQRALKILANWWPREGQGEEEAQFCCGVKQRGEKTTYFSRQERKISTSPSKRYDKRWEEVPSWADGSFKAEFGLVCNGRLPHVLDRLQFAYDCVVAYRRSGGYTSYNSAEEAVGCRFDEVSSVYSAISGLVAAYRRQVDAKRAWEIHCSNKASREAKAQQAEA